MELTWGLLIPFLGTTLRSWNGISYEKENEY